MQTAILNRYSCGITRSEEVLVSEIDRLRAEWAQNGAVCWITNPVQQCNQECPDVEYNKNTPSL